MRYHHFLSNFRTAGLDGNNGFTQFPGNVNCLLEGPRVRHRFHIESKRRDPILACKSDNCIMQIEFQLVSQGQQVGDGQAAPLHGETETHI